MIVIQIMLCIAGIFAFIGAIGMIRFPDFYTRTHAATMITVGGVCLALFIFAVTNFWSIYTAKIFLIIFFILLTSAATTYIIADAAYSNGIKPKLLAKNKKVKK